MVYGRKQDTEKPNDPRFGWRFEMGLQEMNGMTHAAKDYVEVFRFLFRISILPVWLPFYLYGNLRQRRAMARFAKERLQYRLVKDAVINEIAVDWAKANPRRYPLGEYDPGLRKLQRTFKKILARTRYG